MNINTVTWKEKEEEISLNQWFARWILETLQDGDSIKIEWPEWHFDIYKNGRVFGVRSNSLWVEFKNNPMSSHDMEKTISKLISVGDVFKEKIPHEVILGLRDIFFNKNKDNEKVWDSFDVDSLFQNITLEQLITQLHSYKNALKTREKLESDWINIYLEEITKYMGEQVANYPDGSIMKKILSNKMNYLEWYRNKLSDKQFISTIKKNIADMEVFLSVLWDETIENNPFKQEITRVEKKINSQKDSTEEYTTWFEKIYAWDAFAIPYAEFANHAFASWIDEGIRVFAQVNGRDAWSKQIIVLWWLQKNLLENKDVRQKISAFKSAHEAYTKWLQLLLWTGHNEKISSLEQYEKIKNQLPIEKFISLPCSDMYPVEIQKVLIMLYIKDVQTKACEVVNKKSLEKPIREYLSEIKNPSWFFAKLQNASWKEMKTAALETIQNQLIALKSKYDTLNRLSREFKNTQQAELVKIAIEFCIPEDFFKTENTKTNSPVYLPEQEKLISFMEKNI